MLPDGLLGTREAAELFAVRPSNFIRDWARRPDFPPPVERLARGRLWDRGELVRYRARSTPRRSQAFTRLPVSPLARRWLPVIKRRIVRRFHPQRIVLFGSQARGEARPDSDVDLLVVMTHVEHRRRAATEIHAALAGIPLAVDVVVATPEDIVALADLSGTVIQPALAEGRVIYAAA